MPKYVVHFRIAQDASALVEAPTAQEALDRTLRTEKRQVLHPTQVQLMIGDLGSTELWWARPRWHRDRDITWVVEPADDLVEESEARQQKATAN